MRSSLKLPTEARQINKRVPNSPAAFASIPNAKRPGVPLPGRFVFGFSAALLSEPESSTGKNKKRRASGSPLLLPCGTELELDAQAKLNPARPGVAVGRDQLGVNHAKIGQVRRVQSWIKERWVIEGVEEVKGIFESKILANLGDFAEAHVEVFEPEAAQRTAPACRSVGREQDGTKILEGRTRILEVIDTRT